MVDFQDILIQQIKTAKLPAEGDTIGVAFDHDQLNFYLNGVNLEVPVFNVRGTVFPALFGMCFLSLKMNQITIFQF